MVMQQASASYRFRRSNALSTRDDKRDRNRLHTMWTTIHMVFYLPSIYVKLGWRGIKSTITVTLISYVRSYSLLSEQRSLRNIKPATFIILCGLETIIRNPLEIIVLGKGYHSLQHQNNPEAKRELYIIVILQISLSCSLRHLRLVTGIDLDNVA